MNRKLAINWALFVAASLSSPASASADYVLQVGSSYQTTSTVSLAGYDGGNGVGNPFLTGGGSIAPSYLGTSSNNLVQLPFLYCLQLDVEIYVPFNGNALVTNTGTLNGGSRVLSSTVLGQVAWLVDNYATSATTADLQGGLQDAIWKTLYGGNFKLVSADSATTSAYNSELAALGSKTATISSVLWISPEDGNGGYEQDLITSGGAMPAVSAAPEPAGLVTAAIGAMCCGIAGLARRCKKSITRGERIVCI
jgi:hypothetical protein